MAFEDLRRMRIHVSRPSHAAASICYRRTGHKASLPRIVISLDRELAARVGITRGLAVAVQIGSGDDDGQLRLGFGGDGDFVAYQMRSRVQVDLGAFPGLGSEPIGVAACEVRCDDHALLLTVPEWARDLAAKQAGAVAAPPKATKEIHQGASGTAREAPCAGCGRGPVSAPRGTQSAPPPVTTPARIDVIKRAARAVADRKGREASASIASDAPAADAAKPPPPPSPEAKARLGIKVVRTPGHEHVVVGDKTVTLSRLGAHLLDLLLRAGRAPVDESFLMDRLWPARAPAGGVAALTMVRGDLRKLAADGVVIHSEKGFGLRVEVTK